MIIKTKTIVYYLSIIKIITNKTPIIVPTFFDIGLFSFFIINVFINNPISIHKSETVLITVEKSDENTLSEVKTIKMCIIIISAAIEYKILLLVLAMKKGIYTCSCLFNYYFLILYKKLLYYLFLYYYICNSKY